MSEEISTAGPASDNDRLTAMLFLAGLFHLIVILGVTFAPPEHDSSLVPTLEVMLVGRDLPQSTSNDDARYLAEQTQVGAGNAGAGEASRLPRAAEGAEDLEGEIDGQSRAQAATGPSGGESSLLASVRGIARMLADANRPVTSEAQVPRQVIAGQPQELQTAEDDVNLRLKGPTRRELLVTPSTRESSVAVYLDSWRRRVERLGTMNFPNEARRRQLSGNPVVEVALRSSGSLLEVRIRRSSGHAELDQAALEILRLAAPFEAFPTELAARHDSLRFSYEWQFVGGELAGSSVRAPASSR